MRYIPLAKTSKGDYKCLDIETLKYRIICQDEIHLIKDYLSKGNVEHKDNGSTVFRPLKAINGMNKLKVYLGYNDKTDRYIIVELYSEYGKKKEITSEELFKYITKGQICNIELKPDGTVNTTPDVPTLSRSETNTANRKEKRRSEIRDDKSERIGVRYGNSNEADRKGTGCGSETIKKSNNSDNVVRCEDLEVDTETTISKSEIEPKDYIVYNTKDGDIKIMKSEMQPFLNKEGQVSDLTGFAMFINQKRAEMVESRKKVVEEHVVKPDALDTELDRLTREATLDKEIVTTKREIFEQMLFTLGESEVVRVPTEVIKQLKVDWLLTLDSNNYDEVKIDNNYNPLSKLLTNEKNYPYTMLYVATITELNFKKVYILSRAMFNNDSLVRCLCVSDWMPKNKVVDVEKIRIDYRKWRRNHYYQT